MPRPKKARTIGTHSEENMKQALVSIRGGMSVRKASTRFLIPFTTLRRYHLKAQANKILEPELTIRLVPNYEVNKVFSDEQEKILVDYFKYCSLVFYGLTEKDTRKVAYQMAEINHLKMPASWNEHQMAGKGWLRSFRQRHSDLSLRKPEPCSATAFNRSNVEYFFNNLDRLVRRHPSFHDGTRIYNLDETSTTTVQKPQRVIAPKGRRNVGKVTSGERGTLVTTCCIISGSGVALPPIMVFPRKNFKNFMIRGAPPGTLGLATPSGWMNTDLFPSVMQHFITHSSSTADNPSILIMDNHESHLSLEALNLAKASGVHVLTLPPHTSAKLQPLDVGIYGPFKSYYNSAIDSWMMRNPGKPVSIYEIGELVGIAFLKVMTPLNIINAFKKCGIVPFDRDIFDDDDFMPCSVTDRPYQDDEVPRPNNINETELASTITGPNLPPNETDIIAMRRNDRLQSDVTYCSEGSDKLEYDQITPPRHATALTDISNQPASTIHFQRSSPSIMQVEGDFNYHAEPSSTSEPTENPLQLQTECLKEANNLPTESVTTNNSCPPNTEHVAKKNIISPFDFRNPLKAAPRKFKRKPRKLGRSLIATDTPEKNEIELAKASSSRFKIAKKKKVTKKILLSESEEDDTNLNVQYQESDEDNEWPDEDIMDVETISVTEEDLKKPLPRPPSEGEFVLVEFATKKQKLYYIGKILEERNENQEFYVSFLRRKSEGKYNMPTLPDLSSVKEHDIKCILPKPTVSGSTTRQQSYYIFSVGLTSLNMQ